MLYEKKISLFGWIALAVCLIAPLAPAETYDPQRVQEYIDARVDRELNQSIIVGVISLSGERYFTAGQVSPEDPRPPKPDDVFEIGAVTNVFTAAAASSLIVDRQLTWTQRVENFLPDYVATPAFGEAKLQLLHLVTHTSGLPHNPPNLQPRDVNDPFADFTPDHVYVAISVIGLTIPPGQEYRFSMLGYGLLGHVLTSRTGQSYGELIQERIVAPLKLQDTSAVLNEKKIVPGRQGNQQVPNWHWDGLAGGGGLYSSARDLLRFVGANLQMVRVDKNFQRALLGMHSAFTKTSMPHTMVGYGWHITRKGLQGVYWQNGKTGGYASYIGFNPSTKTGCVILTNSAQPLDDVGFYILDPEQFPLPAPPPSGIRPARELKKYEGVYQVGPDAQLSITQDEGKLYATIPGQPSYRIYPVGKHEFAYATGDVRIVFDATRRGSVDSLTMYIGIKPINAKRVK